MFHFKLAVTDRKKHIDAGITTCYIVISDDSTVGKNTQSLIHTTNPQTELFKRGFLQRPSPIHTLTSANYFIPHGETQYNTLYIGNER